LGGVATQAFDLRNQGTRVKPEFIGPYLRYRKWKGKDDKQNEQDEKFWILSIRGCTCGCADIGGPGAGKDIQYPPTPLVAKHALVPQINPIQDLAANPSPV
jgi:hypothetical protein